MSSMAFEQHNKDLEWSLGSIAKRQLASSFVMNFESRLCVYSSSVEQFYTNYTINFPNNNVEKMVILPNPYAFHDTFHGINAEAIRDTGLHVLPGETIGKKGLYLMVNYRNKNVTPAPIPFKQALKKMLLSQHSKDPFLPVLVKGDLREFNTDTPCLHLHRIKLSELTRLSDFEKQSIQNAITDKLIDLQKDADHIGLNSVY